MRRSGTAYPYLTMTTPALIREPRISSMAPAIGPDALPAPTTKIRWIERRSYRRAATRNTCPRRETWRFTAAAGSTARTAAVRIEAACRLRPGLGFPLKRVSWNTAAQSWRVEELESWRVPAVSCTFQLSNFSTFQPTRQGASLPQGAGPVGPHGLDPAVWHRKCLNLHAADPERHAGHKTFRGNSREQISRSRQGTRVGQHRRVQQPGQGASAFGVVIVFVGQQDRSDRRGAGDAVQFARHHLRGQSHVDDEARPRRFEENGVAAAPTTQDAKAKGMG